MKPQIPEGWEELPIDTIIKPGDKCWVKTGDPRWIISGETDGTGKAKDNRRIGPYIRKIQSTIENIKTNSPEVGTW